VLVIVQVDHAPIALIRYYQRRNETTSKFLIQSSPTSQTKSFLQIFQQFRMHFSHLTMHATRLSLFQLLNLINTHINRANYNEQYFRGILVKLNVRLCCFIWLT
jgi:hypothetical protein